MIEKEIQKLGLTDGESRVYISLLRRGKSSVGNIIKDSQVARSKIYDVLNRLIEKGLVGSVKEGSFKKFIAQSPNQLKLLVNKEKEKVKQKEQSLGKVLEKLKSLDTLPTTQAEVLYGHRGIKAFFDMTLNENPSKDEIKVIGYTKEASKYFNAYFQDYTKQFLKAKLKNRIIFDYEAWNLKKRKDLPQVERKHFSKGHQSPSVIYIFGDIVGTIVFTKEERICFLIKNKSVAKGYKQHFEMLWKQSKT